MSMTRLLRLARPQFLITSLFIFILGAFWALLRGADFSLPRLLLGYLMILPAQLSVSFSNDYFDIDVDRHATPTLISGGSGVLVDHPELRKPALIIAAILNLISLALGVWFLVEYQYPAWFLILIILANCVGWLYSAPPLQLAYRGYGELLTTLASGFLVPVTGFLVMMGVSDGESLLLTLPLILYGLASILIVEIPDIEADRLGHKRTWVAQKGRPFGFIAIGLLFLLASISIILIPYAYSRPLPINFSLVALMSLLPLGASTLGVIQRPVDRRRALVLVNCIAGALAVFFVLVDLMLGVAAAH